VIAAPTGPASLEDEVLLQPARFDVFVDGLLGDRDSVQSRVAGNALRRPLERELLVHQVGERLVGRHLETGTLGEVPLVVRPPMRAGGCIRHGPEAPQLPRDRIGTAIQFSADGAKTIAPTPERIQPDALFI